MALKQRTKVAFKQPGVGTEYHYEAYSDICVDDVIASLAQSEAVRRYQLLKQGVRRDVHMPSDALKSYLMRVGEE